MSLLCHFLDSGQGKVVQGGVVKVDELCLRKWVVYNISPEAKINYYLQPGTRMFQNSYSNSHTHLTVSMFSAVTFLLGRSCFLGSGTFFSALRIIISIFMTVQQLPWHTLYLAMNVFTVRELTPAFLAT